VYIYHIFTAYVRLQNTENVTFKNPNTFVPAAGCKVCTTG